jgi:hypothetical protein
LIPFDLTKTTTLNFNQLQAATQKAAEDFRDTTRDWSWTKKTMFIEYTISDQSPVNGNKEIEFHIPSEQFSSLEYSGDVLSEMYDQFIYFTLDSIIQSIVTQED